MEYSNPFNYPDNFGIQCQNCLSRDITIYMISEEETTHLHFYCNNCKREEDVY